MGSHTSPITCSSGTRAGRWQGHTLDRPGTSFLPKIGPGSAPASRRHPKKHPLGSRCREVPARPAQPPAWQPQLMHIQQAAQPPLNIQQGQLLITNRLIANNTRPGKGALATAPLGPRVVPRPVRGEGTGPPNCPCPHGLTSRHPRPGTQGWAEAVWGAEAAPGYEGDTELRPHGLTPWDLPASPPPPRHKDAAGMPVPGWRHPRRHRVEGGRQAAEPYRDSARPRWDTAHDPVTPASAGARAAATAPVVPGTAGAQLALGRLRSFPELPWWLL